MSNDREEVKDDEMEDKDIKEKMKIYLIKIFKNFLNTKIDKYEMDMSLMMKKNLKKKMIIKKLKYNNIF